MSKKINPEEHRSRLREMANPMQRKWDLSPNDVEAIKWALSVDEELEKTADKLSDCWILIEQLKDRMLPDTPLWKQLKGFLEKQKVPGHR